MRLINTSNLRISAFLSSDVPRYGILSHTWIKDEEVTFQEFESNPKKKKPGYKKIVKFCAECKNRGLNWAWVDTCCIDKTDPAELSEAINAMFTWYRKAALCFAHLRDVFWTIDTFAPNVALSDMEIQRFTGCAWFSRGWTLQELLAPPKVEFFNSEWKKIGDKSSLQRFITEATGISGAYLEQHQDVGLACVAEKMSWASKRETTRDEDSAYCLLGLFGVNMPLIYGEGGTRAFLRLQEEILKTSSDHTIFAWYIKTVDPGDEKKPSNAGSSLLAQTPKFFAHSGHVRRRVLHDPNDIVHLKDVSRLHYGMTNRGLQIELLVDETRPCQEKRCSDSQSRCVLALLNCYLKDDPAASIAVHIRPQQELYYLDGELWHLSDSDYERTHLDQKTTVRRDALSLKLTSYYIRRGDVTVDGEHQNHSENVRPGKEDTPVASSSGKAKDKAIENELVTKATSGKDASQSLDSERAVLQTDGGSSPQDKSSPIEGQLDSHEDEAKSLKGTSTSQENPLTCREDASILDKIDDALDNGGDAKGDQISQTTNLPLDKGKARIGDDKSSSDDMKTTHSSGDQTIATQMESQGGKQQELFVHTALLRQPKRGPPRQPTPPFPPFERRKSPPPDTTVDESSGEMNADSHGRQQRPLSVDTSSSSETWDYFPKGTPTRPDDPLKYPGAQWSHIPRGTGGYAPSIMSSFGNPYNPFTAPGPNPFLVGGGPSGYFGADPSLGVVTNSNPTSALQNPYNPSSTHPPGYVAPGHGDQVTQSLVERLKQVLSYYDPTSKGYGNPFAPQLHETMGATTQTIPNPSLHPYAQAGPYAQGPAYTQASPYYQVLTHGAGAAPYSLQVPSIVPGMVPAPPNPIIPTGLGAVPPPPGFPGIISHPPDPTIPTSFAAMQPPPGFRAMAPTAPQPTKASNPTRPSFRPPAGFAAHPIPSSVFSTMPQPPGYMTATAAATAAVTAPQNPFNTVPGPSRQHGYYVPIHGAAEPNRPRRRRSGKEKAGSPSRSPKATKPTPEYVPIYSSKATTPEK